MAYQRNVFRSPKMYNFERDDLIDAGQRALIKGPWLLQLNIEIVCMRTQTKLIILEVCK